MKHPPLPPGTLLQGRYRIQRIFSRHPSGSTYLATDTARACETCIVAEVGDSSVAHDTTATAGFAEEAEIIGRMRHESLPKHFDYFALADRYVLVRDYVPGPTLQKEVERRGGTFDEASALRVLIPLCDAVCALEEVSPSAFFYIHPNGVVLREGTGVPVLHDWDPAKVWLARRELVGNYSFASPEVFAGRLGPASYAYNLGALLFFLTTRKIPLDEVLRTSDLANTPHPRAFNPSLSAEFDSIVVKAVTLSLGRRMSGPRELSSELRRLEGSRRSP